MNWEKMLTRLYKTHTDTEIADAVGCDQSTINRLRNGKTKQAHYDVGIGIIALHNEVFKKA